MLATTYRTTDHRPQTTDYGQQTMLILIPGDDPPQLQGSPHLERLRQHGTVELYTDRPANDAEKIARARAAVCMINSRGAVKWPGSVLRELPKLRMITTCGIGTDAIDLETARELGIVVCNIPGRTAIVAFCSSMSRRAMNRPRPEPSLPTARMCRSKTRSWSDSGTPGPLSSTWRVTPSAVRDARTSTGEPAACRCASSP